LIGARAKRYIVDGHSADNVDIPVGFWWAEGNLALRQNWARDFETWIDRRIRLQAFGVTFRRSDVEQSKPTPSSENAQIPPSTPTQGNEDGQPRITDAGLKVFIGHGHSLVWYELKEFLQSHLQLNAEEFNSVSTAGIATVNRLEEMLSFAAFAFLVMTAEDQQPNGKFNSRLNVIHEAGLFQGRLGFGRAIILLEKVVRSSRIFMVWGKYVFRQETSEAVLKKFAGYSAEKD
jgi:hypothetical protein